MYKRENYVVTFHECLLMHPVGYFFDFLLRSGAHKFQIDMFIYYIHLYKCLPNSVIKHIPFNNLSLMIIAELLWLMYNINCNLKTSLGVHNRYKFTAQFTANCIWWIYLIIPLIISVYCVLTVYILSQKYSKFSYTMDVIVIPACFYLYWALSICPIWLNIKR